MTKKGTFQREGGARRDRRGEAGPKGGRKKNRIRCRVVDRTIGWLTRCRGMLVRYEKKTENYLAVVQLACALLWYRRLPRLTT